MPFTGCTTNGLTNLRRRCACHLDHHRAGSYIVESHGEQCCLGQCAGRDAPKHSEARTLCLLCGPTCPAAYGLPQWHGVLPGSTRPVARYLGPHLDIMGSIRPELERRRAAAFRTWTRFRPVWFRAGVPLRVRRFFSRRWWSPFCTRVWKLFACAPPDYEYLDRFVLGFGRKMMRRKATIRTKLEDGTKKSAQSTEGRCGRNFALVALNGTRTS